MKKKLIFIIIGVIALAFPITACNKKDVIRLSEVTHSIFYAPLYAAINNGYFEEEGFKIELTSGEGADKVMAAITSDSVDVGLMGPEAAIYTHIGGMNDAAVVFGQLTKRDGSFLFGRTDEKSTFKWENLTGKKIIAGRKGGVPAMTLQYVLNNNDVSTSNADLFDTSIAFANTAPTFEAANSTYDYCTLFEPLATERQNAGKGFIIASVGEESGEVPYTAFTAKKSRIEKNPEMFEKFLRAVVKGYNYIKNTAPADAVGALKPSFPETSDESIAFALKSYIEIDAWCSSPSMTEDSFNRLQDIMENAGELSKRADFSKVVYNAIADKFD